MEAGTATDCRARAASLSTLRTIGCSARPSDRVLEGFHQAIRSPRGASRSSSVDCVLDSSPLGTIGFWSHLPAFHRRCWRRRSVWLPDPIFGASEVIRRASRRRQAPRRVSTKLVEAIELRRFTQMRGLETSAVAGSISSGPRRGSAAARSRPADPSWRWEHPGGPDTIARAHAREKLLLAVMKDRVGSSRSVEPRQSSARVNGLACPSDMSRFVALETETRPGESNGTRRRRGRRSVPPTLRDLTRFFFPRDVVQRAVVGVPSLDAVVHGASVSWRGERADRGRGRYARRAGFEKRGAWPPSQTVQSRKDPPGPGAGSGALRQSVTARATSSEANADSGALPRPCRLNAAAS